MKKIPQSSMTLLLLFGLLAVPPLRAQPVQPPEGFTPLFNGKDLSGWWGLKTEDPAQWRTLPPDQLAAKRAAGIADILKHWRVENAELVNDGDGLFLTTLEPYGDFELRLEYRITPGSDSGVYLRGIPQVQIWDPDDPRQFKHGAAKGSGGLWNNRKNRAGKIPLERADEPVGAWNRMHLLMVGERVTVRLNERLVVDHARMDNYFNPALPLPRTGPIQLQTHGGETRWRNIFIREIPADEATRILAAKNQEGFTALFDGTSFNGWTGAITGYEIVDSALRCKQGSGGNLYTEKEYGDFAVCFEFNVPPGGNNGLALRYPGQGNPAYTGLCELQVLDDTAPGHAKLDPRQYHGSAYGMAAAHRGYLRTPGTWNYQRVDVRGTQLQVELNGTLILDTDLAGITEFMNKNLAGHLLPARGHFGFAGHNSPVAFRNITLLEFPP